MQDWRNDISSGCSKNTRERYSAIWRRFGHQRCGALETAIARPYATFGEIDLYPLAIDKGAAILESILINHPFIDGNKRTGYVLMELIIIHGKLNMTATEDERYSMVISVSTGEFRFDEIKTWLIKHTH